MVDLAQAFRNCPTSIWVLDVPRSRLRAKPHGTPLPIRIPQKQPVNATTLALLLTLPPGCFTCTYYLPVVYGGRPPPPSATSATLRPLVCEGGQRLPWGTRPTPLNWTSLMNLGHSHAVCHSTWSTTFLGGFVGAVVQGSCIAFSLLHSGNLGGLLSAAGLHCDVFTNTQKPRLRPSPASNLPTTRHTTKARPPQRRALGTKVRDLQIHTL